MNASTKSASHTRAGAGKPPGMDPNSAAPPPRSSTAEPTPNAARKMVHLTQLLGDAQGIDIEHKGLVYRLQVTRAGKLILTK